MEREVVASLARAWMAEGAIHGLAAEATERVVSGHNENCWPYSSIRSNFVAGVASTEKAGNPTSHAIRHWHLTLSFEVTCKCDGHVHIGFAPSP